MIKIKILETAYSSSLCCKWRLSWYLQIYKQLDDKYPSTNVGKLPIHFDAQWDSYEICKFIIENGGNPNPTLNDGKSALDLADERIRDLILQKSKENQTSTV